MVTVNPVQPIQQPAPGSAPKKSRLRRTAPITVPLIVLAAWFGYLWAVSGVLEYQEKFANGRIRVKGFVKRSGFGTYARHGEWVEYHENGGKAAQGRYRAGHKVGVWTYWGADGRILTENGEEPDNESTPRRTAPQP